MEIERIFKLSLMGRDRNKLTATLKKVLSRGPHEELDVWEAPLIHVGGAGTHYPRRDAFGNMKPRKSAYNLGIIGPQTLALLEDASRDNISTDMTVEIAGFEGEWFDPYDVEGYLEEKGIFIDPSSSFAEAELVEWSPAPSNPSTPSAIAISQPSTLTTGSSARSSTLTPFQVRRLQNSNADLGQWNDYTNMELGAVGFSDARMGSWMNFLQPGEGVKTSNTMPATSDSTNWESFMADALMSDINDPSFALSSAPSPPPRRKNVIIDVSRFVDGMYLISHKKYFSC